MKTVNVHDAKTHFSRLLAQVEKTNEAIVICRDGEPVADLIPHKRSTRIKAHPALRKVELGYDPVEPLAPGEWPEGSR